MLPLVIVVAGSAIGTAVLLASLRHLDSRFSHHSVAVRVYYPGIVLAILLGTLIASIGAVAARVKDPPIYVGAVPFSMLIATSMGYTIYIALRHPRQ